MRLLWFSNFVILVCVVVGILCRQSLSLAVSSCRSPGQTCDELGCSLKSQSGKLQTA